MEINFNEGHKNYLNYSKVYKDIKEKVKTDETFLSATQAQQQDYLMATKAVMETVFMNPNCLKEKDFKDPDVIYILTPNNSAEVNNYYKSKPENKLDQTGYFIKTLITLYFTQNKLQAEKGKEESLVERIIEEQAKFRPLNTMPKVYADAVEEMNAADHEEIVEVVETPQKVNKSNNKRKRRR